MSGKRQNISLRGSFSRTERFRYWFDNRMAKGSLGFIRVLIVASIVLAVMIAGLIILFGFNEENEVASVFWDSIATVLNAWMPSFEDGGPGYIVLMSVSAIAGVLFTSVLIGIITSAIEEKIDDLKRGNSRVLEEDHTVILGFYPGEYTLLQQLILAAAGRPACVVIADEMARDEMEDHIGNNLEVPKNFRIVCRTADITDPSSLEKCSIETCKTVIISPTEDARTIKALLAVSVLLQEKEARNIRVNAIISKKEYRFPPSLAEAHSITALQTNETLAKMIAHSCTQTGLSEAFREIFNFEGSELYLLEMEEAAGLTFEELSMRLDMAVPIGVYSEEGFLLNPPKTYRFERGERILVFSEEEGSAVLRPAPSGGGAPLRAPLAADPRREEETETVIIGHNESLPVILQELPENVRRVYLAGRRGTEEEQEELAEIAAERNLELRYIQKDIRKDHVLLEIAQMAEHIVILDDHEKEEDDGDMETIFLLLNLRDLRRRYDLHFNITAEMSKERNQNLAVSDDRTDFIVASSMSSLFLAQLAENPELIHVFRELLSNEGNEIFLKNVENLRLCGTHSVVDLRRLTLDIGYVLLGYIRGGVCVFNPPLEETVTLGTEDCLIVLGEE